MVCSLCAPPPSLNLPMEIKLGVVISPVELAIDPAESHLFVALMLEGAWGVWAWQVTVPVYVYQPHGCYKDLVFSPAFPSPTATMPFPAPSSITTSPLFKVSRISFKFSDLGPWASLSARRESAVQVVGVLPLLHPSRLACQTSF